MFKIPFLDLPPLQSAAGTITLPGSKSISNRVLLLAGLSAGTTEVHALLDSDDTRVMLTALAQLGCVITPDKEVLRITGIGGALPAALHHAHDATHPLQLFLGNAGTAMRPLCAALALLASQQEQGGHFEMSGVPRMHERPIGDLVDGLRQLGCQIDYLGNQGFPPLRLRPGHITLNGPIQVRGDVSSQFLTALLMALPLASHQGDIVIEVVGELISKPYIEITLNLLTRFGIRVQREGWQRFTIPAHSRYQSPGQIHVEGDASSASYFVALGAIAATDAPVRIEGVGEQSIQGDIRFIEAAAQMGAHIQSGPNWLEVKRGSWPLKAIDLDCNHIPDAAMTLAVMALYAQGTTTLRNIASWRVKETDRIAAMATELRKIGASVVEGPDFIQVTPPQAWHSAAIHTYDDHRVAMCFSLAAFNPLVQAENAVVIRILDPQCVAKTFPDYFEALFELVHTTPALIPVITIDGPTASGKGTLAEEVAQALGYHVLDSGSLYRLAGLHAHHLGLSLEPSSARPTELGQLAATLPVQFKHGKIWLADVDVTDAIRQEQVGLLASQVSVFPEVRQALTQLQLGFRRLPGLVADGRDMGTVIFPQAPLKVFLTASAEKRAERRYKQLISKGIPANIDSLRADLQERDARDQNRAVAPLKPAEGAKLLDNSDLSIAQSVQQVLDWWQSQQA